MSDKACSDLSTSMYFLFKSFQSLSLNFVGFTWIIYNVKEKLFQFILCQGAKTFESKMSSNLKKVYCLSCKMQTFTCFPKLDHMYPKRF